MSFVARVDFILMKNEEDLQIAIFAKIARKHGMILLKEYQCTDQIELDCKEVELQLKLKQLNDIVETL